MEAWTEGAVATRAEATVEARGPGSSPTEGELADPRGGVQSALVRDRARGLPGARAAEGAPTALSPGKALAALKSGNERYVSHPKVCSIDLATQRSAVAAHRAPWATVIGRADGRMPPGPIFGSRGVGEVFIEHGPTGDATSVLITCGGSALAYCQAAIGEDDSIRPVGKANALRHHAMPSVRGHSQLRYNN